MSIIRVEASTIDELISCKGLARACAFRNADGFGWKPFSFISQIAPGGSEE